MPASEKKVIEKMKWAAGKPAALKYLMGNYLS